MRRANDRTLFVSSNGWDAAGARAFGLRVAWVNRAEAPTERLGFPPDLIVPELSASLSPSSDRRGPPISMALHFVSPACAKHAGPATGKRMALRGSSMFEFVEGKIQRVSDYWDRRHAPPGWGGVLLRLQSAISTFSSPRVCNVRPPVERPTWRRYKE